MPGEPCPALSLFRLCSVLRLLESALGPVATDSQCPPLSRSVLPQRFACCSMGCPSFVVDERETPWKGSMSSSISKLAIIIIRPNVTHLCGCLGHVCPFQVTHHFLSRLFHTTLSSANNDFITGFQFRWCQFPLHLLSYPHPSSVAYLTRREVVSRRCSLALYAEPLVCINKVFNSLNSFSESHASCNCDVNVRVVSKAGFWVNRRW